jgi:hypothetical protein
MDYIPACQLVNENEVWIPVLGEGKDTFCIFIWNEEESGEEALKRAMDSSFFGSYDRCKVFAHKDHSVTYDEEEGIEPFASYKVYEISCARTGMDYFLIVLNHDLERLSDLKNLVCVPRHTLNLLKFAKEYLLPFSDAKIGEF